jgi:hypothetical protein
MAFKIRDKAAGGALFPRKCGWRSPGLDVFFSLGEHRGIVLIVLNSKCLLISCNP